MFVAFSVAHAAGDHDVGDVIRFTEVIVDVNPGFPGWNPATSVFYCPYDGLYFFTASIIRDWGGDKFRICLKKSNDTGNVVCISNYVSSEAIGNELSTSSTMSAVVRCQAAESVWLEMTAYGGYLYDVSSLHYNHFSGWLLRDE